MQPITNGKFSYAKSSNNQKKVSFAGLKSPKYVHGALDGIKISYKSSSKTWLDSIKGGWLKDLQKEFGLNALTKELKKEKFSTPVDFVRVVGFTNTPVVPSFALKGVKVATGNPETLKIISDRAKKAGYKVTKDKHFERIGDVPLTNWWGKLKHTFASAEFDKISNSFNEESLIPKTSKYKTKVKAVAEEAKKAPEKVNEAAKIMKSAVVATEDKIAEKAPDSLKSSVDIVKEAVK